MNVLPKEKQIQAIAALTEGCSIRATERMTGVHRDTIMRLAVRVGGGCTRLHDTMMRGLSCSVIELDEQWAFIGKKQKRVTEDDSPEMGDCWLWIALDATSKVVISYQVGKRPADDALDLCVDLRDRITTRPQITADGYAPYVNAIEWAFTRRDVDFAQLIKVYQSTPGNDAAHRYSPGSIREIEVNEVFGNPKTENISTSYVERFNLTTRMQMRRFTRLTNGFSKKLENHKAAIGLHIAHYNFCRIHETIRCTPAMQVGVTDHVWTLDELIEAATTTPKRPPAPEAPRPTTYAVRVPKLRLINGGRS